MATGYAGWQANGSSPNRGKLSPEDERILQQPYAQAVSFMGHRPELIVYSVKMLQRQQKVVEVGKILLEVEKFEKLEQSGGTLPPLESWGPPQRERLGSDGDVETDDAQFFDAESESPDVSDGRLFEVVQAPREHQNAQEMQPNEGNGQRREENRPALQRKLMALRYENRLLKARQQCRNCMQRPVSITFLPCGHYSYCYDCGHQFTTCPICRKTILADVKTFLA